MKKILPIFFFINFSILPFGICLCQTQKSIQIDVKQNFGKKEKYIISIEKYTKYYLPNLYWQNKKLNYSDLSLLIDFVSITEVELDVKKIKGNLYSCTWTYGPTKLLGISNDILNEDIMRSFNLCNGMRIKFLIDKNGRIQKYTNYNEYKSFLIDVYKKLYSSNSFLKDSINESINLLQPTFENNENILETYFEELPHLFSIFGTSIKTDLKHISNSSMQVQFDNKLLLASVDTKVDSISESDIFISVKQTIINKYDDSFTNENNKELDKNPDMEMFSKPRIYIISVYSYDYKNNLIKEYYREKIIESKDVKKIEGIRIIMKNSGNN
jgi:hypothetical protein